jgi:hypothetical protein
MSGRMLASASAWAKARNAGGRASVGGRASGVYQEALCGRPGRIDALVHAELGGRPYMAHAFEKMVQYCKQFEDDL